MNALEIWTMVYAVATLLILIILGASAWWAWGQLKEVRKSRQFTCLMALSEKWSSDLIREARRIVDSAQNFDEVWKSLEADHCDDYFKLVTLANFFEDLAILEKEGQITFEQVINRFGPTLTYYHGIYEGFIAENQKEDPSVLENFDKLAKRTREGTTSSRQPS